MYEEDNVWSPNEQNVWGDASSPNPDLGAFGRRSSEDSGEQHDEATIAPEESTSSTPNSPPRALVAEPEEMPWDLSTGTSAFPGGFPSPEDPFASETPQQEAEEGFEEALEEQGGFDDFGDFGDVHEGAEGEDDGFGDFEESEAIAAPLPPVASTSNTRPIDMTGDVAAQAQDILSSIIPVPTSLDDSRPERELFGSLEQLLISDSSRQLYSTLVSAPTEATALQWKRSKTRQAYFAALGIPLDLETESASYASKRGSESSQPRASTSSLAAPQPSSSNSRPSSPNVAISSSRSAPVSRAGSPAPAPPSVDRSKAQRLIGMSPEELRSQPLETLREIQEELEDLIKVASAQLTHGMDVQEKLAGDAQTYDRMIQDLVSTAQKLKPAASSTVSMSNAGQDLQRTGSLPHKRSTGLWGRSRVPSPAAQQGSSLRKTSMH